MVDVGTARGSHGRDSGCPVHHEKSYRELATKIASERQVVHLLAKVRKLLELRDEKATHLALNFGYCWALYTKMDQSGAECIVIRG
jgi:hypothetical protein